MSLIRPASPATFSRKGRRGAHFFYFARYARESFSKRRRLLDCFVASLLAMTVLANYSQRKTLFRQTSRRQNPFLINGARSPSPSFSKFFLCRFTRFQWLTIEKNWKYV